MADKRYSIDERVFMVLEYGKTENYREVQRRFGSHFKTKDLPSSHTIKRAYENFVATGSVEDHYKGVAGAPATATTDDNIQKVKKYFEDNPKSSVRIAAATLGLSATSVHRILTKSLDLYPYKVSVHQPLDESHQRRRYDFANHLLALIDGNELDPTKIWFSDEAHFWLHGYVNKQNFRIWGSENPHFVLEKPLHPKKVTVWMAVSGRGVCSPIIFENTVTGQSYEQMLRTHFFPEVESMRKISDFWFMQDGARPHRTDPVFQALNEKFGTRIIGLDSTERFDGAIEWPPYSPDLNPCDFWLWGFLKDAVYKKQPKSVNELKNAIRSSVIAIGPEVAKRAVLNFVLRLRHIINCEGSHIENILN